MILLKEYHLDTDKAEEVIEMLNEFLVTHEIQLEAENIDNDNGIVDCVVNFDGIKIDEILKIFYDDDDTIYAIREVDGKIGDQIGQANLTYGAEMKHLATAIDKTYSKVLQATFA